VGDYAGKDVSARKILKALKWKPEVGFEEGGRRTVEWFSKIYQNETGGGLRN
jgi:nucleoside-diphosphate-sugar epimerase